MGSMRFRLYSAKAIAGFLLSSFMNILRIYSILNLILIVFVLSTFYLDIKQDFSHFVRQQILAKAVLEVDLHSALLAPELLLALQICCAEAAVGPVALLVNSA